MDLNLFVKYTTLLRHICIAIIILLSIVSCHPNSTDYPEELRRADSLCSVLPDSALLLLEQFGKNIDNEEEATQRYYQLLTIKAQDKACIPHTSDSLIKKLVTYYEKSNDEPFLLAEAYYYAGRTNFDIGDSPQAVHFFQQASDILRKKPADADSITVNQLLARCESQMGYVFLSQHLYAEALKCISQSYIIDSILQDTLGMTINLRDLGMIYQTENDFEKAILYYHRSADLARIAKDTIRWHKALCQEALSLIQMDKATEAKDVLFRLPSQYIEDWAHSKFILAIVYDKTGVSDSATYYFEQVLNVGSLSQKSHARLQLADRAIKLHDPETALTHLKQYVRLNNEIDGRKDSETTALVNSLYNYNLRAQENVRLKQQQESFRAYSIVALLGALFLILLLFWSIITQRQRRTREKRQNLRLKLLLNTMKYESEQSLLQSKERIVELEKLIETDNTYQQSLIAERDSLLLRLKQAEIIKEQRASFHSKWKVTPANLILQERAKNAHILTEEDWHIIETQLQDTDPLFFERLSNIYEFSTIEWRISILIKLHVSPSSIANLVSRSNASISVCRKRLYTKVMAKEGKAEDWDAFIRSI